MGRLTTHVLDTANGRPAAGVRVALYRGEDHNRVVAAATTNADGRCDEPILEGEGFTPGTYELIFHVGDYYRDTGHRGPEPAFLDVVVIRFGIADADEHYHVPLLVSPFGYTTYRGS